MVGAQDQETNMGAKARMGFSQDVSGTGSRQGALSEPDHALNLLQDIYQRLAIEFTAD